MSAKSCMQQERLDIEEKYTSLQEEAQGKTKKLKKVWTMLMAAKSEVSEVHSLWWMTGVTIACSYSQLCNSGKSAIDLKYFCLSAWFM